MNWGKFKSNHFYTDPVEHFYASTIFGLSEYDRLYENQNNLTHKVWQEFDEKYKTGFEFHQDLKEIDTKKEVICLWFFKERSDKSGGDEDILLKSKPIRYYQNSFLVTKSIDLKITERKKVFHRHNRRPVLQLDMKTNTWEDLVKKFR